MSTAIHPSAPSRAAGAGSCRAPGRSKVLRVTAPRVTAP